MRSFFTTMDKLEGLVCPDDRRTPLDGDDAHGLCCPACGRQFPVRDGIPRLLPARLEDATADDPATRQLRAERAVRDAESDAYDTLYSDTEYRHELATYVRLLAPRATDAVLEVGAGTGRVAKEFAPLCRRLVAVDLSHDSLRVLRERLTLPHLKTLEAEATALPLADGSFDRVAALSVVCFLPDDAMRGRLIDELHRVLRPGGIAVVSTYLYSPVKRLWAAFGRTEGALRTGRHSGGKIAYRNETRGELIALLDRRFAVEEVRGVCHRVPLL